MKLFNTLRILAYGMAAAIGHTKGRDVTPTERVENIEDPRARRALFADTPETNRADPFGSKGNPPDHFGRSGQCAKLRRQNKLRRAGIGGQKI